MLILKKIKIKGPRATTLTWGTIAMIKSVLWSLIQNVMTMLKNRFRLKGFPKLPIDILMLNMAPLVTG